MALIPADAGLRIRLGNDAPLQPLARPQEIPADLPDLRQGTRFIASIQEVLPDSTYRALVAGKSVTLALPDAAKAGDTLELVVVDRTPKSIIAQVDALRQGERFSARILEVLPGGTYRAAVGDREVTLRLDEPAEAGQTLELVVRDRSTTGIVATRATLAELEAGNAYPYTTLSRAAKLIGSLLTPEGENAPAAPLNRGQPLLGQGPTSVSELAGALAKAVTQSGLFYEAHQAQWLAGKRPMTALLNEPQGQHSQPALMAAQTHAAAVAEAEAGPPATAGAAAAGMPEELRPLVQQQLDAATTQRLLWHGEIWPGQEMDWQVQRRPAHEEPDQAAAEDQWSTRLSLHLPRLGSVKAAVSFAGGAVSIGLAAADADSAAELRTAAAALEQALAAAGVNARSISVKNETG